MRLFSTRAPNKSSSDRIKDLKAKNIFTDTSHSFNNSTNRHNNYNNTIRYTKNGELKSVNSNELKQLLARGQSLCKDGLCRNTEKKSCYIPKSNVLKKGLLNCSRSKMATAVKVDTNTNLFSHYVQELLPYTKPKNSFPMAKQTNNCLDITIDPKGLYMDICPEGGYNVIDETVKEKHLWNATTILGEQDINGIYKYCQGGNNINLSWGNNTKQNYLVSYHPKNKVVFTETKQTKKPKKCFISAECDTDDDNYCTVTCDDETVIYTSCSDSSSDDDWCTFTCGDKVIYTSCSDSCSDDDDCCTFTCGDKVIYRSCSDSCSDDDY